MFQQALAELGTPPPSPDEEVARINGHYDEQEDAGRGAGADVGYDPSVTSEEESDYGASVAAASYFAASTFDEANGYGAGSTDAQSRAYRVEGDDVEMRVKHWPPSEAYSPHL